jgi:pyruvate, orthophosphate dikinase
MTFVFDLGHDHHLPPAELLALVGGKAANLGVMAAQLHLPVPPGFVVSTEACRLFLARGWPEGLDAELREHMRRTEQLSGRRFGAAENPLLVSVRSGAPVSMPGMMDTVLNVGLNDETTGGLAKATGSLRFARDCRRRFVSMFAAITGSAPPDDPWEQLRTAVGAVFGSWNSERAQRYRTLERLPGHLGTAATVQAMVFGNRGPDSATGVLFTRNPATGDRSMFGDVLFDAQGEDVVAGRRQTLPVAVLEERMPEVATSLRRHAEVLERYFTDMCDIEFTIERGRLWLLQVRVGKRSPRAALRLAVEMAEDPDFPLSREDAVRRVGRYLLNPPRVALGRADGLERIAKGLPASPGMAVGGVATSPAAVHAAPAGRPLILVRAETSPEDVPAMAKVAGVLTSLGGLASHAAVIARGWGVPAVVGTAEIEVDDGGFTVGGRRYADGETISIDGSTGEVFLGSAAIAPAVIPEAAVLVGWSHELGIELREADDVPASVRPPDPTPQRPVSGDDVIRCLSIKGSSSAGVLAASLLSTAEAAARAVGELAEAGTVTAPSGIAQLTQAGAARAAELIESDRRQWGGAQALAALDAFLPLDERVKATVTAWQVRQIAGQQVLNDHLDAGYDAEVLAGLQTVHGEVSAWFSSLGGAAGWLRRYLARLDRAVAAAVAGDHRFLSSPLVDSYHGVWFELHEDLIRLAGRTRAEEAASGRA